MFRVLLAALCLAACAPAALPDFNPITTDPAGLTVAFRLEPTPAATPAATMFLAAQHPDGRSLREEFDLEPVERPQGAPADAQIFYRFDPDDAQRLAGTRATISDWKADAPATRGQFSVALDIASPVNSTVWISPSPGAPFALIVRDAVLP